MAAIAAQQIVVAPRAAVRRSAVPAKAVRLAGPGRVASSPLGLGSRRGAQTMQASAQEMAQVAFELNSENITIVIAAVVGLGAGLGIPIFFVQQEERDKERLEEIRELNRATLKATGEQMSEEEIMELRPSRYLDRREFKDDD